MSAWRQSRVLLWKRYASHKFLIYSLIHSSFSFGYSELSRQDQWDCHKSRLRRGCAYEWVICERKIIFEHPMILNSVNTFNFSLLILSHHITYHTYYISFSRLRHGCAFFYFIIIIMFKFWSLSISLFSICHFSGKSQVDCWVLTWLLYVTAIMAIRISLPA